MSNDSKCTVFTFAPSGVTRGQVGALPRGEGLRNASTLYLAI